MIIGATSWARANSRVNILDAALPVAGRSKAEPVIISGASWRTAWMFTTLRNLSPSGERPMPFTASAVSIAMIASAFVTACLIRRL